MSSSRLSAKSISCLLAAVLSSSNLIGLFSSSWKLKGFFRLQIDVQGCPEHIFTSFLAKSSLSNCSSALFSASKFLKNTSCVWILPTIKIHPRILILISSPGCSSLKNIVTTFRVGPKADFRHTGRAFDVEPGRNKIFLTNQLVYPNLSLIFSPIYPETQIVHVIHVLFSSVEFSPLKNDTF